MPHRTARCPLIRPAAGTAVDFRLSSSSASSSPSSKASFLPSLHLSLLTFSALFSSASSLCVNSPVVKKTEDGRCSNSCERSECESVRVCVTQHMPTHWASAHCLDRLSLPKCKRKTNMFFTYLLWYLAVQIVYSCAYIFSVIFQICSQNLVFEVQILPHIEFFCFYLLSWL